MLKLIETLYFENLCFSVKFVNPQITVTLLNSDDTVIEINNNPEETIILTIEGVKVLETKSVKKICKQLQISLN